MSLVSFWAPPTLGIRMWRPWPESDEARVGEEASGGDGEAGTTAREGRGEVTRDGREGDRRGRDTRTETRLLRVVLS